MKSLPLLQEKVKFALLASVENTELEKKVIELSNAFPHSCQWEQISKVKVKHKKTVHYEERENVKIDTKKSNDFNEI